jgi:hypothetical protein
MDALTPGQWDLDICLPRSRMLPRVLAGFRALIYHTLGQDSRQGRDQPRSIARLGWVNIRGFNYGYKKDLLGSSHPVDAL